MVNLIDMRIVELLIDENELFSGIEAISIVDSPAIEENFIALSEQKKVELAEVDKEKKILMGAALIPNKNIYRTDGKEEYYIYFSEDTVRKASELFLMRGNQSKSTLEHQAELHGLTVVESWIVEDEVHDKSRKYGLDMPVGTWMVSMKVNNDEVWNDYVKTGKVKGFSIEGYFTDKVNMSRIEELEEEGEAREILLEIANTILGNKYEFKTYGDYGQGVRNNAKRGIELNKKVNNKCATSVGKIRAQQLSRGEKLSVSTIKRMYSYLSRAETYYDPNDTKACGTISYLLWGGKSALSWSRNKLRELGEIDLAEVDSEGNVVKSPKAPKSDTPNKSPKGKGSAKGDASGKTGAKVSAKDKETLKKKSDEFNEKYKEKLGYGVTVGVLASVFQRGLGAYNTSHSPNVKSASQWAFARVNAFLYLVKNGKPQNAKYTTDYDLLPKKHPKASKLSEDGGCGCKDTCLDVELGLYDKTYSDYPEQAKKNAAKALKYKEDNNPRCGTPQAWQFAQLLVDGTAISRCLISEMASYNRFEKKKGQSYSEGCGGLLWDAWGGEEGIRWAEQKLDEINKSESRIQDEE